MPFKNQKEYNKYMREYRRRRTAQATINEVLLRKLVCEPCRIIGIPRKKEAEYRRLLLEFQGYLEERKLVAN